MAKAVPDLIPHLNRPQSGGPEPGKPSALPPREHDLAILDAAKRERATTSDFPSLGAQRSGGGARPDLGPLTPRRGAATAAEAPAEGLDLPPRVAPDTQGFPDPPGRPSSPTSAEFPGLSRPCSGMPGIEDFPGPPRSPASGASGFPAFGAPATGGGVPTHPLPSTCPTSRPARR